MYIAHIIDRSFMAQSKIDHFFGPSRGNTNTKGVGVGGGAHSDDDEPMIPSGFRITAASDIHAQRSAKRSKFEGEAEECSECEYGSSASDSFVVSDHVSECSSHGSSEDVQRQLSEICSSLRHRRQWMRCTQCLRLVRAILVFLAQIQETVPCS